MNKKTTLFILITLTAMLILLTSANATNIENNTNNNGIDKVSEKTTIAEPVVKEKIGNTQTKTTDKTQDKQITKTNKTQKNKKKDSIIINGTEYTKVIENQEISEYTILDENTYVNNITITVDGEYGLDISPDKTCYINNSVINAYLYNQGTLYLSNTTLNCVFDNQNTIILDDMCSIGPNFMLMVKGNVNTIEPLGYIEGNTIIENKTINYKLHVEKTGNLTLINCSLSNNNIDYENDVLIGSVNDGLLLDNKGNSYLINCSVENNIFNDTYNQPTSIFRVGSFIGAISNKGNMIVESCIFRNNSVGYRYHVDDGSYFGSDYFVGDASCIYNIGNLSIKESLFENNYAGKDGAAILSTQITKSTYNENGTYNGTIVANDGSIIIDNTTFINNTAATTGITLSITGSNNIIENSTLTDTINAKNLILNNNTINTAITITNNLTLTSNNINTSIGTYNLIAKNNTLQNGTLTVTANAEITNNTFTTQSRIQLNNPQLCNIHDNTYLNASINDQLTLNIPQKIYAGEPITITGTYTINTPEYYDSNILEQNKFQLYINDELNQTSDTLEFTITPTNGTIRLTVQPTISQTRKTEVIRATTLGNLIITPENYNEYIYEGTLLGISQDTKILFQGTFTDKGEIYIDTSDIILDGSNATFTNTMFTLEATGTTLQNMNITNIQTEYPIKNTANNNIITENTITLTNTDGKTAAIYNQASNTEISHNTIYVDGPALTVDYSEGYGVANTQAILLIGGDQNTIEYNNIHVTSTDTSSGYGTVEGITNHNEATNTQIQHNNITVEGNAKFNYAINSLANVQNITIKENNIQVTGERYTDGIQVGNGAQNIIITKNNIKCICQNTTPVDEEAITYGIITTNMGSEQSNNITIKENNIDLTGSVNYGIEVYQTTNTIIDNNTINVNGLQSMGIGYAHSPNSTITGNTIKTNGDSTTPLTQVTEEIKQANVGIQIQQDSDNILIQDNTIQTYDKGKEDTCINITTNNVTVKDNNLTSTTQTGDNTIQAQPDTIIDNNNAIEQESTTQTTTEDLTLGDNTTLTAQFYDDTYTPAGNGKAIFKVNGKTLRDNQGNVIYADVINGRAELPNINITQEWMKEGTTIQAIYVGDNNNPIITEPTTVTVTKPEATITIEAPTEATAGETITLKATVTDCDKELNSGRVAFKLNGKTLKDPETGKALYATVENGVATITYTIPEKTKAKEYTLTAVFTDTKYDRVEAETILNVVKT